MKKVKITILKTAFQKDFAEEYAVDDLLMSCDGIGSGFLH